jgi:hypothetical protein
MAWKNIGPNKNTQFLERHIEIGKILFKKKSKYEEKHTQCKLGNYPKE